MFESRRYNSMRKSSLPMVRILISWKVVTTNSIGKSPLPMLKASINWKVAAVHANELNK
jgi:hypothetical protein